MDLGHGVQFCGSKKMEQAVSSREAKTQWNRRHSPPPPPPPPALSFPRTHPAFFFSSALAIQTIYTYKRTYKQFETGKQFIDCKNSKIIYTIISMTKLLPVFYSIAIIIIIVALFPSLEHSHCASVLMWPLQFTGSFKTQEPINSKCIYKYIHVLQKPKLKNV